MASTGLNFTNITPDDGEIRDLSQILLTNVLKPEALGSLFNVYYGRHNGDKLGVIGDYGLVGKASGGCSPTFGSDTIATAEKEWDMAEWEIAEGICYSDLIDTFVKYSLKSDTQMADLTGNDYLEQIVRPRLELAMQKMYLRLAYFGDSAAAASASGGVIKNAADVPYFKLNDGIWKQAFAIVTADSSRQTAISANSQLTFALQKSTMFTSGNAIAVLDNLILDAPARLRQSPKQVIYITQGLKDALDLDIKTKYSGSDLHWKSLFNGITEATYNGIKVVALPFWDEIIFGYEGDSTAWNLPYRAIYTDEDNLLLGVGGVRNLANLDIWFEKKDQKNYLLAKDTIGSLIADDGLVQFAY